MTLSDIQKELKLKYYQYELTTAVYMLEPWEKYIVNSLVIVGSALFFYTTINYTPEYIRYFGSLITSIFS